MSKMKKQFSNKSSPLYSFYSLERCLKKKYSVYSLGRHLKKEYPIIIGGKGNYLFTKDGRKVFDASSGAAVSCLGHGNKNILKKLTKQMDTGTPYLASTFWSSKVVEKLCSELISGTDKKMDKVYLTGSGSEAMESAIKVARQYFYEKNKNTSRVNINKVSKIFRF